MLPEPGQKLAFAAGHRRVLRQVGMAVDQPRKNRDRTVIYPANAFGTVASPEVVVLADRGNFSVLDNDAAPFAAPEGAEFRRVD